MNSTAALHPTITISRHAFERARERLGWPARVLERMASRIFGFGLSVNDTAGALHRYMEDKEAVAGALARSYGETLFIFQTGANAGDVTLVTVWPLPGEIRGSLRRMRQKACRE